MFAAAIGSIFGAIQATKQINSSQGQYETTTVYYDPWYGTTEFDYWPSTPRPSGPSATERAATIQIVWVSISFFAILDFMAAIGICCGHFGLSLLATTLLTIGTTSSAMSMAMQKNMNVVAIVATVIVTLIQHLHLAFLHKFKVTQQVLVSQTITGCQDDTSLTRDVAEFVKVIKQKFSSPPAYSADKFPIF
jgi:hypothetical protein